MVSASLALLGTQRPPTSAEGGDGGDIYKCRDAVPDRSSGRYQETAVVVEHGTCEGKKREKGMSGQCVQYRDGREEKNTEEGRVRIARRRDSVKE